MSEPQSQESRSQEEIVRHIIAQSSGLTAADEALIIKAFQFAKNHLGEKVRRSGELYITHSLETAKTLASWKLPPPVIAAGLIHSTTGSGDATEEMTKQEFGNEILSLIKGTRSLTGIHYMGLAAHAEDLRRFFIAFAKDLRIVFIAFAHRLHTMRILQRRPKEDQLQVARETLEIYAPLANRLSMGRLKAEFETLAFPFVHPEEFKRVNSLLKRREPIAKKNLEKIYRSLRKYFAKESIPIILVDYRLKNIYSLWRKLLRNDNDITKIRDLLALRIVTDSVDNCYKILGLVHSHWRPLEGKVKDYIANPKPNGYQSIHTTIFTGDGNLAEIQIRTREMHEEAEFGVTAHVAYDESDKEKRGGKWQNNLGWVKEMLAVARRTKNMSEFAEAVELDFFKNRIFVFTPTGDVIELPEESTPLDFAYAIHSDLGNRAHAAKINGKHKSLDTPLHGGETIFIETSKLAKPSSKWLKIAHTSEARKKIRAALHSKTKVKS